MKRIYETDGIAAAVEFKLSAGVRKSSTGSFQCVDEENGCPTEALILCGFKQSKVIAQKVEFLVCMDEEQGEAVTRAHTCAQNLSLPWDSINSCSSSQSPRVLQEAADYFATHAEVNGFPTIQINGKEPWGRDYKTIMDVLCQTGISAGACMPAPPYPTPTPSPPAPPPPPTPTPSPSPASNCSGKDKTDCIGSCTWCAPWETCFTDYVPCLSEKKQSIAV